MSWSCLLGTALVDGEVARRQAVTYSHLVVMVCKGTAAGKGPFTITLSSGMLYVSLGFNLCFICCEIHFVMKLSHLSLHLVLIERVPYAFLQISK